MNRYGLIVALESGHSSCCFNYIWGISSTLWLSQIPFSESKSVLCTGDQRRMMIVNEAITPLLSTWEVLYDCLALRIIITLFPNTAPAC